MRKNSESGQSLVEVLIGLSMAIIIVGALINMVVSSLRNSQFAKTSAQATKYAQEGIEILRTDRDRSSDWGTFVSARTVSLWCIPSANNWILGQCSSSNPSHKISGTSFIRDVLVEVNDASSVMVTVTVNWTDQTGVHKSELSTLLSDTSLWH